jgi:hypothetical protein
MRIRSVALAYMAGMGLIALSGSAVVAYKEWRHLATVDEAEALVRVIGSANRFIEAMALERGVYTRSSCHATQLQRRSSGSSPNASR